MTSTDFSMKPDTNVIISSVKTCLPDFIPTGEPEKLTGGNLNYVWRLTGDDRSVIVKHAPPHIAVNPEVPLNQNRIHFETKALRLFSEDGILSNLSNDKVAPPDIYGFDPELHLLIMEDVMPAVPFFDAVLENKLNPDTGYKLGKFIGQLHQVTFQKELFRNEFNNLPIQETRLELQYKSVAESLEKAGFKNTKTAALHAEILGKKLLETGNCLLMGDLWPPSIFIQKKTIRLIDWEFTHYGRPLQDIAHFGAHCFLNHTAQKNGNDGAFKKLWSSFLNGYKNGAVNKYSLLITENEKKWISVHTGAEILVRTAGAFKNGYLFEDIPVSDPRLVKAVQKAQELLALKKETPEPEELW